MKTLYWLLRREMWESRSVWRVPALTAVVLMAVTLVGLFTGSSGALSAQMAGQFERAGGDADKIVMAGLVGIALLFFVVLQVTQYAYLVECLYAERKDRSVLFWKSLPLGDTAVVASKVLTALLVMPLFALCATAVTQIAVAAAVSVRLGLGSGVLATLWSPWLWLKTTGFCVYELLIVELWALPLIGWVVLVSAVAPRSPALIAVLVPLVIALIERLLLGTNVFLGLFVQRMGVPDHAAKITAVTLSDDGRLTTTHPSGHWADAQIAPVDVAAVFGNPALWWGLLLGLALLALAVVVRRRRDPAQ